MSDSEIILRVSAKAGRSRVSVSRDISLGELKQKLATHFKVPINEIALSRDSRGSEHLIGDSKPLSRFNLNSGDEIFMHTRTEGELSTAQLPSKQAGVPKQTETTPSLPSRTPPKPNTPDSARRGGDNNNDAQTKKSNFSPFESYLSERNFDIVDLPLCRSFKPVPLIPGEQTKLPAAATLKHQAYRHVDQLEIMNVEEINDFVKYWKHDLDMCQQRAGFLFGYYVSDPHYEGCGIRAVAEALYEPPQIGTSDWVNLLPDDPLMPMAVEIASAMNLEVIGWIVTHLPRDQLVSATEAISIGKLQWQFCHPGIHYTGYPVSTFVTLTISPDAERGGETTPNAFMVSDLGMAFLRDGIIDEANTGTEDRQIHLKQPKKSELFPEVLESGKPVSSFDVDWLLVRVNESMPVKVCSRFARYSFPKTHRPPAVQAGEVGRFLSSAKCPANRPWEKYSDFHFLLFVAQALGLESALTICECINSKRDIDADFVSLLESL